jgi:hypothetical protein
MRGLVESGVIMKAYVFTSDDGFISDVFLVSDKLADEYEKRFDRFGYNYAVLEDDLIDSAGIEIKEENKLSPNMEEIK